MDHVKFTQLKNGDKKDCIFRRKHELEHTHCKADRLLTTLVNLDKGLSGYHITRLCNSI